MFRGVTFFGAPTLLGSTNLLETKMLGHKFRWFKNLGVKLFGGSTQIFDKNVEGKKKVGSKT